MEKVLQTLPVKREHFHPFLSDLKVINSHSRLTEAVNKLKRTPNFPYNRNSTCR